MSVNRSTTLFFFFILVMLSSMLVMIFLISTMEDDIAEAGSKRFESYKLARELRQTSDDLTRMARLLVMTGDERFLDYFNQIVDIRDGKAPRPLNYERIYWDFLATTDPLSSELGEAISLKDLMIQQGFTLTEFHKLSEAKEKSDALIQLESLAMNSVRGIFKDEFDRFTVKGEPNFESARNLMFGPRYRSEKAKIMKPINDFFELLEYRTATEIGQLHSKIELLVSIAFGLCAFTVLVSGVTLVSVRRRVLLPLSKLSLATEAISNGNYEHQVQHESNDEIGKFVKGFNGMVNRTRESILNLEDANSALNTKQSLLELEKKKSEELLLNILPAVIADRLKSGETEIADEFVEVSVIFVDVVDFTKLSDRFGPAEVVRFLNDIFAMFDNRVEEFGLEKIKTIGDCYMAVCGIPVPVVDHAHRIADFGFAVRADFYKYIEDNNLDIKVRIGAHSGSATAGIVGKKKFVYDLWGDVVNVASRMESTGVSGEIQVTESFMVRLMDTHEFESRGEIDVKGKGILRTYFLKGRRFEDVSIVKDERMKIANDRDSNDRDSDDNRDADKVFSQKIETVYTKD